MPQPTPRPSPRLAAIKALSQGLTRQGAQFQGYLSAHPQVQVYSRPACSTDLRTHWYITPDARLWLGATFSTRQNPGPAIRQAISQLGQDLAPAKPTPLDLTLERLGL